MELRPTRNITELTEILKEEHSCQGKTFPGGVANVHDHQYITGTLPTSSPDMHVQTAA